jgi:O-antigen ligase
LPSSRLSATHPPNPFTNAGACLAGEDYRVTISDRLTTAPTAAVTSDAMPAWFSIAMLVVFGLIMPVAYAGSEGEALVAAAGGLISLPFVLRLRPPPLGVALIGAIAVWSVITFAWSPLLPNLFAIHRYKQLEALTPLKLLLQAVLYPAFVYGALRLPPAQRDRALQITAALLVAATAILVVEAAEGGKIFWWLNSFGKHPLRADLAKRDAARACYTVALLIWPLALMFWRRVPVAIPGVVLVANAASALVLGVDSPAVAMVLSLLVFLAARVNARAATWACMVAVVLYHLAAPLVFLPHGHAAADIPADMGKLSWHIRVGIWRFASLLIAHKPLLGYGLDASRVWPDHIPMHPHDAAIQIWLETGVLGALLAALFWGWLFYRIERISRTDPVWAAAACATAVAYLLIGAVSFGVWQEWWLGLGAAAIALCAMVLRARREEPAEVVEGRGLQALG